MLDVRDLSVAYGGLRALSEVTLSVPEGRFVTLVGPNGAGKSTLFKTISGVVPPVAGTITFDGEDLLSRRASARAHVGIAHVPEGRQVFKTLTVRENLEIGRGLASAPRLLMLDEPSMGLAPSVADMIFERISQIHREDGLTILLVEQRVAEALERSDHGYVLETGRIVLEGPYETLLADDRVRRSYLGLTS
jgi:branched-chain amino acid transport system ATP-binding protein